MKRSIRKPVMGENCEANALQPLLDLASAQPLGSGDLRAHRLALSTAFMRDASSGHLSLLGQADAAFDAGYLAVLVVLGPEVSVGHPHPAPLLIQSAAAKLNLPGGASDEALAFISRQYDVDYRQSLNPTALLNWARLIRAAAGIDRAG